jgi:hypothetical protein
MASECIERFNRAFPLVEPENLDARRECHSASVGELLRRACKLLLKQNSEARADASGGL